MYIYFVFDFNIYKQTDTSFHIITISSNTFCMSKSMAHGFLYQELEFIQCFQWYTIDIRLHFLK